MSYSRVRKPPGKTKKYEYLTQEERRLHIGCDPVPLSLPIRSFKDICGTNLPEPMSRLSSELWEENILHYIAGGAVASSIIGEFDRAEDIDIFFPSFNSFKACMKFLMEKRSYTATLKDKMTILNPSDADDPSTLKFVQMKPNYSAGRGSVPYCDKPIQLVKIVWYENVWDVIESFDLSCVKFALYEDRVFYTNESIQDIRERRISVNRSPYPVSLISRIKKYVDRGFKMRDGGWEDIIRAVGLVKDDLLPDAHAQPLPKRIDDTGVADWSNPQYRKDYYDLEPVAFSKKWETL